MKGLGQWLGFRAPATQPRSPVNKKGVWVPTHRHRKGGLYRLLCYGILEANREDVAIYDDADGTVWVRPRVEFDDGRFMETE